MLVALCDNTALTLSHALEYSPARAWGTVGGLGRCCTGRNRQVLNRRRPSQTAGPNAAQPPADEWRRYRRVLRSRIMLIVAMLAVIGVAFVALRGSGSRSIAVFNSCIRQTRFLVLERHRSGHGLIEAIRDRAGGALVGEFAAFTSVQAEDAFRTPMAGTGEANGRWVLFTTSLVGRDANAILSCGNPEFPLTPGS